MLRDFLPSRLEIPDDRAKFFVIRSIRAGGVEQMVASPASVPAALYSTRSVGAFFPFDVVRTGHTIEIEVECTAARHPWLVRIVRRWLRIDDSESKEFYARMLGTELPAISEADAAQRMADTWRKFREDKRKELKGEAPRSPYEPPLRRSPYGNEGGDDD